MLYKVELKDGRVLRADKVDIAMGWVTIVRWSGELRLPASDVLKISVPNMENFSKLAFAVSLVLLFCVSVWAAAAIMDQLAG